MSLKCSTVHNFELFFNFCSRRLLKQLVGMYQWETTYVEPSENLQHRLSRHIRILQDYRRWMLHNLAPFWLLRCNIYWVYPIWVLESILENIKRKMTNLQIMEKKSNLTVLQKRYISLPKGSVFMSSSALSW